MKKVRKTEKLGFRLSKPLLMDMDICRELYGLSYSNQIQIGLKSLHKNLSDEKQNIKSESFQRMATRFSHSNEALDKED